MASKCDWCGSQHERFSSYCSKKCEWEHRNGDPSDYEAVKKGRIIVFCLVAFFCLFAVCSQRNRASSGSLGSGPSTNSPKSDAGKVTEPPKNDSVHVGDKNDLKKEEKVAERPSYYADLTLGLTPQQAIRCQQDLAKVTECKTEETIEIFENLDMKFVSIPPGEFVMGSVGNDPDENPRKTYITKWFYMGKYEITQKQWRSIMGYNPSTNQLKPNDQLPVDCITWNELVRFVEIINKGDRAGEGWRFVIPTEAQWEYSCRAGSNKNFHFGDDISAGKANYFEHSRRLEFPKALPVGKFQKNDWGLCDMHGNVSEWCSDWYSVSYNGNDSIDPQGPVSGIGKVIRGGCFRDSSYNLRSSFRMHTPPDHRWDYVGGRIALVYE